MTPAAPSAFRPQPLPESSATLLRLLATATPNWAEAALVAARDPALCLLLLLAAPLAEGELDGGLDLALRQRLSTLGADLLRAWLLGLPQTDNGGDGQRALLVAECALHLALETRYPRPDEAYLGGLWLTPSALGLGQRSGDSEDPGPLFLADDGRSHLARLVHACGLPDTLADAVELGPLLDEQALAAHPLVRLLKAADSLAGKGWETRGERIASLTGLTTGSLHSLRTDVGYIVSGHAAYPPPAPRLPALPASAPGIADDPFRSAALHGLVTAAFADQSEEATAARLRIATPLLTGQRQFLLLAAADDGLQHPLLPCPAGTAAARIQELRLREEDESSVIALALRSGRPATYLPAAAAPGRSMADWHIGRWLGRRGFCCLPLPLADGRHAVALLAVDREQELSPTERWLLNELLGAGARAIVGARRLQEQAGAREDALKGRFREHVRRIAHEATNPLTVLKTRLGLMAQNQPEDEALQDEMGLLNAELDRIGNLLRRAGDLPADESELPRCRVGELLQEMRTVYGDALFASRDIHFELRIADGVAPAAMPASALKQVLLNLFRNASEALQPGGRLSVALVGQVSVDGRNCVEIRLIDNGPGLPPERAADLFSPRPSSKGGGHQGVGLSVVRDILVQWKASILCRSQPGSGTSFQVFVPLEQSR